MSLSVFIMLERECDAGHSLTGCADMCRVCTAGECILPFSPTRAIRGETRRLSRNHSSRSLWIQRVQRQSWRS